MARRWSALFSAALLQTSAAAPQPRLDLRVDGAWRAWRVWQPDARAARDSLLARVIVWRDSAPGLRVGDFDVRVTGGLIRNDIAVVEIAPARFRFSLAATAPGARRTVGELIGDSTAVFVSNTGLFRPDGSPQGLVLVDGVPGSALAGWLDVVVAIEDGRLRPTTIDGGRALTAGASAFQVLPWLVRDGRIVFGTSSGVRLSRTHRDRRLTLCFGDDGLVRFALSNFSFLARGAARVPIGLTIPEQAMVAAALGCRDAIALDGGISAQVAVRAGAVHRWPGFRRVPLLLVAHRR